MGIYPVHCPTCYHIHMWFSGNLDQRCKACKDEMNGPNFEGDVRHGQVWRNGGWHQIAPRAAVIGDIVPWGMMGRPIDINVPPRYSVEDVARGPVPITIVDPPMSFGEWARNIRTVKLMELNKRMSDRLLEADASNATKQDKINALQDIEAEHQKLNGELREHLKIAEEERDTARARAEDWHAAALVQAREVTRLTKELNAAKDEMYTIQQLPGAFRYAREFVRSGNVTYHTVGARDYADFLALLARWNLSNPSKWRYWSAPSTANRSSLRRCVNIDKQGARIKKLRDKLSRARVALDPTLNADGSYDDGQL
jgi:hypothetical protein